MKKWIIGLLIVGGLIYVVKKTSLVSYAGTLWCQATRAARSGRACS